MYRRVKFWWTASAVCLLAIATTMSAQAPAKVEQQAALKVSAPVGVAATPQEALGLPIVLTIDRATIQGHHISGGSAAAEVTANAPRHITNVHYEPIVVAVQPGSGLESWMNATWNGSPTPKDGSLHEVSQGMVMAALPVDNLAFRRALLTGVVFPTLDASSKDDAWIQATLAPELVSAEPAPGGAAVGARPKRLLASHFRFTISGLDGSGIHRIESFTVGTPVTIDETGHLRESVTRSASATKIENITILMSEAKAAGWLQWYEDFLIKGNHSAANEKSFTLEFLEPDMKTVARLEGSGVGIVSARWIPRGASRGHGYVMPAPGLEVELYANKLQFTPVP